MSTISAFPITAKKATELSTASTLSSANSIIVYTTDLKTITFSQFLALLSFQTQGANLDTINALPSLTDLGENLLVQDPPSTLTSYLLSSILGVPSFKTPTQVVADLLTNGGGVDLATAQSFLNKKINGVTLSAGTALLPDGSVTDTPTPSDTFPLRIIKIGYTGGTIDFQFTKSTKVTFPSNGVLATVTKVVPVSDATVASASTINLDNADGSQVDVTGTTTITAITLAENSEKVVRFTGVLILTHGANLQLPGNANITTAAGDYAIFKGGAGSVVSCVEYRAATSKVYYGGDVRAGASVTLTATSWLIKNADYVAVAGDKIQVDTVTGLGAVQITLPVSPSIGDAIQMEDGLANFASANLTIARNGQKINGATSNFVAATNNQKLNCVYISAAWGWSIK